MSSAPTTAPIDARLVRARVPAWIGTLVAAVANTWWAGSLAVGGDRAEVLAAAVVMGVTVASTFAYGLSAGLLAGRLTPLLWGYLPGLAAVLGTGLLISAVPTDGTVSATAVLADCWVLLNPLLWVPFVLLGLALRRWQRLHAERSGAPTSGTRHGSMRSRTAR